MTVVFCDVDGVIAGFSERMIEICGQTKESVYNKWIPGEFDVAKPLGINEQQMWDKIRATPNFWRDLPLLPNAQELIDLLLSRGHNIRILTKPSLDPVSSSGKQEWIQKHFNKLRKYVTLTQEKWWLSANDRVLIDDADKNIFGNEKYKGWNDYGGFGIIYPQIWNSQYENMNRQIEYVKEQLWLKGY